MLSKANTAGIHERMFEEIATTLMPCTCSFCRHKAVSTSSSLECDIPWPKRFIILMISAFPVNVFTALTVECALMS